MSSSDTDHEEIRGEIRACQTIADFGKESQDLALCGCEQRIAQAMQGKDAEAWSKHWAEALSRNEPWAFDLNMDRKTLTVFLFEVCNRYNPEKNPTITAEEICTQLGPAKLLPMIKNCLIMDRANANYNMIDQKDNIRGMHWYAEKPEHRTFLQQLGALSLEETSGHTMNKRYLWLVERMEFAPLGLAQDAEITSLVQPRASPLRVLAVDE